MKTSYLEILQFLGDAGYYARTESEKGLLHSLSEKGLVQLKKGTKSVFQLTPHGNRHLSNQQNPDCEIADHQFLSYLKEAYNSLLSLDGIGEATATNLYQGGFRSVEDVAKSNIDELIQVKGISDEKAKKLIESATRYIESREIDKDTEEERLQRIREAEWERNRPEREAKEREEWNKLMSNTSMSGSVGIYPILGENNGLD